MSLRLPAIIEIGPDGVALLAEYLGHTEPAPSVAPPKEQRDAGEMLGKLSGRIPPDVVELPETWELVEEREGETYHWPAGDDEYVVFRVYEGRTSAGSVRLAIGECTRERVRGKERKYFIAHYITPAGSKRPIAEFLETDDYRESGELIAIIKGSDGGGKMYDPADHLPPPYDRFQIETYRDRIDAWGSYNKLGVVAHETDVDTILGHTLIQAQSRFGLGPS